MASTKPDNPAVKSFADHEVITPPNRLEGVVGRAIDGDDPIARAEAALAQLSSEFSSWMDDECEKLDRARRNARQAGMAAVQREAIQYLADAYGLRNLSPALREAAQLRLSHPDETLAELGRRCNPPVGKATLNGRLASVMRLVKRLRGSREEPEVSFA